MSTIKIILKGNIPSKKNSRITNRKTGRSFPSKDYSDWHKTAMLDLLMQGVPKIKIKRVEWISVTVFFPTLRKADITNKIESVMDLMVDYGLLEDDNFLVVPMFKELKGVHRKNDGGCAVKIVY